MAKALMAGFLVLFGILTPVGTASGDEIPLSGEGVALYDGPSSFVNSNDPFQTIRWMTGLYIPKSALLNSGGAEIVSRLEYDVEWRRALISYYAGQQQILPPVALSLQEYSEQALLDQLRRTHRQEATRSVLRSSANAPRQQDGLFSFDLVEIPFTEKLFGKGAPNLTVRGRENITISGTSSWEVGRNDNEFGGQSIFPKLDMRQDLNVQLKGTIGSKLTVDIAQNSNALTPLENAIKIRYKGEEDEVLQTVELGNTNLSLPATQYVSYSARQEGLFGVKATAKVGSLDITAIASRQEGQSGDASLRGGSQQGVSVVRDMDFIKGKFFFLSDPDSAAFPRIDFSTLAIYLDDNINLQQNDQEKTEIEAEVFLDPTAPGLTPDPYEGRFHQLIQIEDYTLSNDVNYSIPILELRSPLQTDQTLAIAYIDTINVGGLDVVREVGTVTLSEGDTTAISLKMIRPQENEFDGEDFTSDFWTPTRRYEIKGWYRIGDVRDVDEESFELQIFRKTDTERRPSANVAGTEIPYLEILGLDQEDNATGERIPDGRVDRRYIDYSNGYIFFPDLRPFDPSAADVFGTNTRLASWGPRPDTLGWEGDGMPSSAEVRANEVTPAIYDLKPNELSRNAGAYNFYEIEARFQSRRTSIQLNAVGAVIEGSETVRLDDRILQRGQDYTIFYDRGVIEFRNPDATAPGADLVITYNYDSPFSSGSQSLLGGSIAYNGNSNYRYSTSWLTQSKGAPESRPRLGAEPRKTTVGDLSGEATFTPWVLTDLMNSLPLVRTSQPSRLNLSTAAGLSLPDPNTKNVVYIDDMEGAEIVNPASLGREAWFYPSVPTEYMDGDELITGGPPAEDRGKMLWFRSTTVLQRDLNPSLEQFEGDDAASVLEVVYIPNELSDPRDAWGGLVTTLSPLGLDLSESQFIEIWVNDFHPYADSLLREGELRIDIGEVSEDAVWDPRTPPLPPNNTLDIEDVDFSGGTIDFDEDLGLDGVESPNEILDPERLGGTVDDPAADDQGSDFGTLRRDDILSEKITKFEGINGTERNRRSDGEDLNNNYRLDDDNNYVEYTVKLSDSAFIDVTRDYSNATDPETNGWRLYRIPIQDPNRHEVGRVDLARVQHMRMWFRGIAPGDSLDIQIGGIDILGNRWEQQPIVNAAGAEVPMGELAAEGTNVNVAVVNNKQNQQEYVSPFGVERRDRVTEREQSLSLEFQNFAEDYEFRAFRTFPETRDYTQYKTIAFYLNPKLEDLGATPDSVEFFLRFGTNGASDTLSYYEVSTRLTTDDPRLREDGWLDFRINVADLSAAKTVRPTVGIGPGDFVAGPFDADTTVIANGDTTQFYARRDIGDGLNLSVRGLPSFNQIRRLSVGVRNVSGKKIPDGRVWFNEIRMGDVRRDTGWVGRAAGTLTLADVAVVNGGLTVSNEDFVRLGEERGSGARDVNYNYGATVNLHKFVEETGFNAPLKYTTRRSKKTPKFFANSDIEFSGENTGRDITETGQDDLSISISRTPRGRGSFLTRYSIDAMRFSALSSKSFNNGVTQVDTTERRNTNLSYSLSLNPRAFKLFPGLELRPTPRQLGVSWSRSKTERASYTRDSLDPTKLNLTQNRPTESGELSLNTSFNPITNVTYSFNAKRDLIDENFSLPLVRDNRPPRSFLGLNIGRETSQGQNISANYTPPFGGIFSPRLTANSAYAQDFSPNATREGYSAPAKNVNNSSNVSLNGRIPIGRLIAKLFPPPSPEGQSISASKDIQERRQRQDAHIERMLEKERERKRAAGVIDSTQVATPDSSAAPGELEKEGGLDPEEEKKEPKSSRNRLHSFFTNVIKLNDIQGSGSVRRSSSYSLIDGSPGLAYRFGLTQDVGLDDQVNRIFETLSDETLAPRTNSNFGKTNQLRASTQATAFKKIQMDFNFQHSVDERNSNTTNTVTKNTVWPEIKFNWGDIHKSLPIVKSLFSEFRAVSSSFRKETRKQGTAANPDERITVTTSWNPLIRVEGTIADKWKMSFNLTRTGSESTVQTQTGSSINSRGSTSIATTVRRTFERRGKQGANKNIDFSSEIRYTRSGDENKSLSIGGRSTENKDDSFDIRNTATLRFTRTVSGTFGLNLGQQRDITAQRTTRSIGVSFQTGFNF